MWQKDIRKQGAKKKKQKKTKKKPVKPTNQTQAQDSKL